MTNKSRGDYACTLLDVDAPVTKEVEEKLPDLRWCIKGSYCKIINAGEKKIIYGLPGYAATVHFSYAGNSQSVFFAITQEGENNGRYQTILCIRPREDEAAEIAALPYDVYNREEAKR